MVHGILQDLIFAARSLVRTRGVTSIAVVSLAIGIAANATIFSVVSALEFPRLIYPDASRLVFLESRNHARGLDGMLVSVPDALDLAASTRTLQLPALTADQTSVLREAGGGKRISGRRVDSNFFPLFGVPPPLGRALDAGDGPDRLVLSDSAWRSYFGGDPAVIGRAIHLDGGAAGTTMRDLEAAVLGTDSTLLVEGVRTLEADAAQFVAPIRMMTSLLAACSVP